MTPTRGQIITHSEQPDDKVQPAPSGPAILIVSRNSGAVRLLSHQLSRSFPRHLIKVAHTEAAVAELISGHNTQCVMVEFTDTPQSERLLQSIRDRSPHIPVVALSKAETTVAVAETLRLGAVDCLPLSDLSNVHLADTVRLAMQGPSISSRFPLRATDPSVRDFHASKLKELVFVVRSSDGKIVSLGGAGLSAFGLSPDDAVGQHLGNVGLLGRGGKWKAILQNCALSGESHEILVAEHGLRRNFSVRASSELFCGSEHYFVVARDLSSRSDHHSGQVGTARKTSVDLPTGVANRAAFEERLGLCDQPEPEGPPLFGGLLRIELDQLPRMKKEKGELVAERSLRQLALTLDQSVRKECDLVARYSDKQIAVILENIKPGKVISVADRLVKGVRKLALDSTPNNVTPVSISVGAAAGNLGNAGARSELFTSAEFALRQATERGNRSIAVQIAE